MNFSVVQYVTESHLHTQSVRRNIWLLLEGCQCCQMFVLAEWISLHTDASTVRHLCAVYSVCASVYFHVPYAMHWCLRGNAAYPKHVHRHGLFFFFFSFMMKNMHHNRVWKVFLFTPSVNLYFVRKSPKAFLESPLHISCGLQVLIERGLFLCMHCFHFVKEKYY